MSLTRSTLKKLILDQPQFCNTREAFVFIERQHQKDHGAYTDDFGNPANISELLLNWKRSEMPELAGKLGVWPSEQSCISCRAQGACLLFAKILGATDSSRPFLYMGALEVLSEATAKVCSCFVEPA